MRKVVQETGTEVPIEHEGKEYTVPVLKKILAKEPGAQVLGAEIKKDGIVEVFLYDGPTELIEVQKAECPGCDRDTLAEKVKQTTMLVLSHCFGESCARVGRSRAPAEACRPFEVPRCEGPDDSVALVPVASDAEGTPAGTVTGPEISPRMTRLTKGAVWGLFAASAATTAALLAANYTGAGRVSAPQGTTSDILLPAATATGILSVIALGVAIPTTIIVDRATHPPRPPTGSNDPAKTQAMGSLLLQCPN